MSDYFDGRLLVAPPKMRDWRFAKSVVYIWKHDVAGAAGIIINRPLISPTFKTVCEESEITHNPDISPVLYYGGPVMNAMVGMLHTLDYDIDTTNKVSNGLGFTLDRRAIEDLAQGVAPANFIVTMGMASWDSGQLEQEISAEYPRSEGDSWLVMDYQRELVFHPNVKDIWEMSLNMAVEQSTNRFTSRVFKN
jgi:putative transcriptional regulator